MHFIAMEISRSHRNKQEAVHYMNQYLVLNDSIKDLDLTRQVDRLQFQLEIEKKEKENELLKLNEAHQTVVIDRQRNQNLLLFIVLFFAISLAGIAWYYSRRRRHANLMLRAQNKFIELQRSKSKSEMLISPHKSEIGRSQS